MTTFIELDRRFEEYRGDLSQEELTRRSYLAGFYGRQEGLGWDDLLKHRLVVVLGEPGSGKTEELKERHRRCRNDVREGFFLRLDQLVGENLDSILGDDEIRRFERWAQGSHQACFFGELGSEADALMVAVCAALSGRWGEQTRIGNPSYHHPAALVRFIPMVNRHVRSSEDIKRAGGGVYSHGPRDGAQDFRSSLWEVLKTQSDASAETALEALLDEPSLADEHDWILHLLEGHKRLRAEGPAWEASDIRAFAAVYRAEPRSDYALFRLVRRLVMGIKNEVERSENATNRLQVRSGDLEKAFQGFLCRELSEISLGWYSVTQESEMDLAQRPDLRVERLGLNPLPVEVKLANLGHWTYPKLQERLENQLVGQYLRPAKVRHGLYILGNTEPNRYWEVPDSRERLYFEDLIQRLQVRAADIQAEMREGVDGIEVISIDFSDPRQRRRLATSPP